MRDSSHASLRRMGLSTKTVILAVFNLLGLWSVTLYMQSLRLHIVDIDTTQPFETVHGRSTNPRIRLFVISVTSASSIKKASRLHESWSQFLGPFDNFTYVCDEGCTADENITAKLHHVTELDSSLVSSINRNFEFEKGENRSPWGYRLAQLKFYYGLVHHVRQFHANSSGPMPEWFYIKDDDTHVHADRLMDLVQGVDFATERVSLAGGWKGRLIENRYPKDMPLLDIPPTQGCSWPNGGAGWLISRAQATTLALEYGDRVLEFMRRRIEHSLEAFHYDIWIPEIASWGGGKLYHSPSLKNIKKQRERKHPCRGENNSLAAFHTKNILLNRSLEEALRRIEKCFQQPFVIKELLRDRIAESKSSNGSIAYCHLNHSS